jgi:hypothetical protein
MDTRRGYSPFAPYQPSARRVYPPAAAPYRIGNITTLRRWSPRPWAPPGDTISQTRTLAAATAKVRQRQVLRLAAARQRAQPFGVRARAHGRTRIL